MSLRSDYLWRFALGEQPPTGLPSDLASVRVGMALGLRAIDALVAVGADVGPVKYCLVHGQLLVPVEADTVHRWKAAHSQCVPAAPSWSSGAGGYRSCTGLWVTRPGPDRGHPGRRAARRAQRHPCPPAHGTWRALPLATGGALCVDPGPRAALAVMAAQPRSPPRPKALALAVVTTVYAGSVPRQW
ncbi:hypothetical protein ACWDBD_32640 [Streptomyces sp. NPDC001118]